MYAKILHRIKNMGFRKKITGISLAISLIPVILLGIFSYGQMRSLMLERESLALRETLRQETDHLNYKLESYLSALNLICWNEGIRTSLSKDYETNVDMYLAYRDVIDPMFLTVRSLNRDITSISVYTDNHMNPHGNVLRPLEEAAGEAWFDQACRSTAPFFQISEDGRSILLLCQFYYKYVPYTNILCMTIDLASALDTADSLFEDNYGFLMASAEGESLFRFTNISGEAAADVPDGLEALPVPSCGRSGGGHPADYLYRAFHDPGVHSSRFLYQRRTVQAGGASAGTALLLYRQGGVRQL